MANLREFQKVEQLNQQFAADIIALLTKGIAEKGRASLFVSGGRTPKALFNQLSETEFDWQKVDVCLVDERWVDEADAASNTAMVKREFLVNKAAQANFVSIKNAASDADTGLAEAQQSLSQIKAPFDVVILGMGEDGHTASIFPCADAQRRDAALDMNNQQGLCVMTPATAPHQRISLTLKAILSAKQVYLHLVGENKKPVLDQAMSAQDITEMPIRAVLQQAEVPVDIMYCANKA